MSQHHLFPFSAGGGSVPPGQQPHQEDSVRTSNMSSQQAPLDPALQAAVQQNAELAGIDMSVLEGISPAQLAAIARMFQSGAFQMPPPAQSAPPQESNALVSTQVPPQIAHESGNDVVQEDVNMDTEEGEVDENAEEYTPPTAREFLRPPPTGPKNRSVSPRRPGPRPSRIRNSLRSVVAQSKQPASPLAIAAQPSAMTNGRRDVSKDDAAKMFVLEMTKAGYSFDSLASEVRDPRPLVRMFKELKLPIPSERPSNQPPESNGEAAAQGQPIPHPAKPSPHEEPRKVSLTKRTAVAKPAPVDRSEYLARLQAVKNKKSESTAPVSIRAEPEPVEKYPPSDPPDRHGQSHQVANAPSTGSLETQSASENRALSMTELARQKLEALRAQQAAKQNRNGVSSFPQQPVPSLAPDFWATSSPSQRGLGAGIADIPARVAQGALPPPQNATILPQLTTSAAKPASFSPTSATPSRALSGLPGLFMAGTPSPIQTPTPPLQIINSSPQPAQATSLPTHAHTSGAVAGSHLFAPPEGSPGPLAMPRKRPVASDFDDIFAQQYSAKRPFGQSRGASEDESLVIQVSDDEDEGDEMETDSSIAIPSKTPMQTKSFRDVGPLRDFPLKPNFQLHTSTPGTPSGVSYEQKMKEIEEFKRKIAEKERRQRVNGKAVIAPTEEPIQLSSPPSVPMAHEGSTANTAAAYQAFKAGIEGSVAEVSSLSSLAQIASDTGLPVQSRRASSDRAMSATQLAKQQERERLRKRLLELEEEEGEDVDEAVEAATAEAQSAVPAVPPALEAMAEAQAHETGLAEPTAAGIVHGFASEEGELSDDSMTKFYNVQSAQLAGDQLAVPVNDVKNDSQATTASATTEPEAIPTELNATPAQVQSTRDEDSHMLDVPLAHEGLITPLEPKSPESNAGPHLVSAPLQDVPAPQLPREDVESSDEDDDADEDLDQIYGDLAERLDATTSFDGGAQNASARDLDSDDGSSRRSSSSRSEGFEPIPEPAHVEEDRMEDMPDDELVPALQPTSDEQALVLDAPDQDPAKPKRYFTPYESPLKGFREYRYHPDYLKTVSDGYKSLTYSHNIDPVNALCPFETAGGICNDPTCQNQHFKSMVVSDNDLLKNMGAKDIPAHSAEETRRWNEGLGAVVRELRNSNLSKDVNGIAAAIAQYRREFVGDPTKIVNLG